MSKHMFIFASVALTIALLITLALLMQQSSRSGSQRPDTGIFPIPIIDRSTSTVSGDDDVMDGGSVTILPGSVRITEEQFVKMKQVWHVADNDGVLVGTSTSDYAIAYTRTNDQFLISIVSEPVEDVQRMAEQELRRAVLLSDAELCGLNIEVYAKSWSTDDQLQTRTLSFCK